MAKKNKPKQAARPLKPAEYVRERARQLPVYKCYQAIKGSDNRDMLIIVVRKHPQGSFTYGVYILDNWCLGVTTTSYQFNVGQLELDESLSVLKKDSITLNEIGYVEAHNWIYGALDFAAEAGVLPAKNFSLTQYILAQDDDDVELIEYDFGFNGEHCLVAENRQEAAYYIPTLDYNLGRGNYKVKIGDTIEDWVDDEDSDVYELEKRFKFLTKRLPQMEYTYKGMDYPTEINLHHPKIEGIIQNNLKDITVEEINEVMSIPADELREDLQNIILREIGRQWRKNSDGITDGDSEEDWITANALVFMMICATVEDTLPVVLELMRQKEDFRGRCIGDLDSILLEPVLFELIKDRPSILKPYLLEPGLNTYSKQEALELLERMAYFCPQLRTEIVEMTVELLHEYKRDLPQRTICDSDVTAMAIGILVRAGAVEYLPLIKELYDTGLIDEWFLGSMKVITEDIQNPHEPLPLPPTDPYAIREAYIKFYRQNYEESSDI